MTGAPGGGPPRRPDPDPDPRSRPGDLAGLLARCTFPPPGAAVTCGLSGGPDSAALVALAAAAGCVVHAIHVDHGLRAGSGDEAAVAAAVARRFGATFVSVAVEVGDGPNLEARARDARRSVLPADVLLGHTADDQAETVLAQLLRGTGPEGLAAMDRARRPILSLRRSETRALCADLGLEVVDDPSNSSPRFRRNRIRHELLPLAADVAGRDVVPLIARMADLQRDAVGVVDELAAGLDPTDGAALAGAPVAVARQAVRRWWRTVTGSAYAPDAGAVERILAVARGDIRSADVTAGWRVARTGGRLRLERDPAAAAATDGAGGADAGATRPTAPDPGVLADRPSR